MKNLLYIIVGLLFPCISIAQEKSLQGYVLTSYHGLYVWEVGADPKTNPKLVGRSLRFSLVDDRPVTISLLSPGASTLTQHEVYKIRFWDFGASERENKRAKNNPDVINNSDDGKYFYLQEADFKTRAETYFPKGWTGVDIGFSIVPFRLRWKDENKNRPADADFTALSAIPTAVTKWSLGGSAPSFWGIMLGAGITSTRMDSKSFFGTKDDNPSISEFATPKSIATATIMVGIMYMAKKGQIALTLGFDTPGSQVNRWKYNGAPWTGIAIGFPIFSTDNNTASRQSN